jgi:hypothetical protein
MIKNPQKVKKIMKMGHKNKKKLPIVVKTGQKHEPELKKQSLSRKKSRETEIFKKLRGN